MEQVDTSPAAASSARPLQVLTLGLGGEIFAVETELVHEVLDLVPITEVPNSRPFIKGLINVRGKVVPVADLKCKFGMPATERTNDSRVVVMEVPVKAEPTTVGVLADCVYEVTELDPASVEDAPRIGMKWRAEFIRAIGKRGESFIIVMDVERVLASEEHPAAAAVA